MSDRRDHLARVTEDLENYVKTFCPCTEDGKYNDFSGEKCNDAFLMLHEAMNAIDAES